LVKKTYTVDITPSWSGLLPYMIAVLEDSNHESRKLIKKEFQKMACAADIAVEFKKREESQTKLEVKNAL
jgi:hypothetical protein